MQVNNQTNNYHVPYTGGADDIMGLNQWEQEIQHIQQPGSASQNAVQSTMPQGGTVLQTKTTTMSVPQNGGQASPYPMAGGGQGGMAGGMGQNGVQNGTMQSGMTGMGGMSGMSGMNGMNGTQQNSMSQNGMQQNSMSQNGMQQNSMPQSGMQQNSMPQSGMQQNSMPQSGTPQGGVSGLPARMGNYLAHEHRPGIEMGDVSGWRQDESGGWVPVFTGERAQTWQDLMATTPLDMSNPASMEATDSPMTQAEAAMGSLKGLLGRNLGHYVVATFVVGTRNFIVWRGILETVGNDYLVIYQPTQNRHISCDFYALKFIEFHSTYSSMNDSQTGMGMEM